MKKTITIDTDLYKVVPIGATEAMLVAARNAPIPAVYLDSISAQMNLAASTAYRAMLAAVPSDLPGVVAHSGEPSCYGNSKEIADATHDMRTVSSYKTGFCDVMLFTHPPAQPDTEAKNDFDAWLANPYTKVLQKSIADDYVPKTDTAALQARIAELERINLIEQAQSAHWRSNHDNMVKKAAILSQRLDLPVDRIPAYRELERLQARAMELDDHLENANTALRAALTQQSQLAAQAGQISVGYLAQDWYFIVSDEWVAKFGIAPRHKPLYAAPPAPANSLAIVQAALDAAAKMCEDLYSWRGTFTAGPMCTRTSKTCADAIRAINPQTIIDRVSK